MEFIVIRVSKAQGEETKKTLDEQFCKADNPLAGAFTLLKEMGAYSFVIVPMRAPLFAVKLSMMGLKKSLKGIDKKVLVLSVKASPFDKDELVRCYDEEVARFVG